MKATSPVTKAFDTKTFADGFRRKCLCIPFNELELVGPEGSFPAKGMLVSRGDKVYLEHSPIPFDGSSVPKTRGEGIFGPENWWKAKGVSIHGLNIHAEDLLPPAHGWSSTNGHTHYSTKVQRLRVSKSPIPEVSSKPSSEPNQIWSRASLAEAKLGMHNESQIYEERNPFFDGSTYMSRAEGTWIGEIQDWRFCFRPEEEDLFVHLETNSECNASFDVKADHRMNGILKSLSFMQAGEVIPWRVQHSVDHRTQPDVFTPHFQHSFNHATPIGGPMLYQRDFVMSMFVRMADYFADDSAHVQKMKQFLWQLNEARCGKTIDLHKSMHLCAILEGMCNQVLSEKFGWSKTQLKKPAIKRFRELSDLLSLSWEGQFERVISIWNSLRDDLAHGNFFGTGGAWHGDLFALNTLVTGGIQAILLKDANWPEHIDFRLLGLTSHLYYQ